jgi:hypothetical protein
VLVPYGALYLTIWGLAPSEYGRMSAAIGFNFGKLGWRTYLLLVEPEPWYPSSVALLNRMPWLILSGAGLLAGLIHRRDRIRVAIVALPTLAYCIPMICYRDIMPSSMWVYGNIHYYKWVLLLAPLFAWQFVVSMREAPAVCAACLAALLALSCISFQPVVAGPDAPARLVVFAARRAVPDTTIVMGDTTLIDRAGSQQNSFEMHAIPAGDGLIKVLAQTRDFLGDERIVASPPSPSAYRAAPGVRADGTISAAAFGPLIGRFKPEMQIGVPCWLPIYRCPQSLLPALSPGQPPAR